MSIPISPHLCYCLSLGYSCPSKSEMVSYHSFELLMVKDVKHHELCLLINLLTIDQGSFLHPSLMRGQMRKEVPR